MHCRRNCPSMGRGGAAVCNGLFLHKLSHRQRVITQQRRCGWKWQWRCERHWRAFAAAEPSRFHRYARCRERALLRLRGAGGRARFDSGKSE